MEEAKALELLREGEAATVVGRGELDLKIAPELDIMLQEAIASSKLVAVDLRDVDFIDSAIVKSMVDAGRTLYDRGVMLNVVVSAESQPEYVMGIAGFDDVINVDAVEA